MNPLSAYRWSDLPRLAGASLLLVMAIQWSFAYLTIDGYFSIFWIPSGLALAIILRHGAKYWPAVFLASLATDLWRGTLWQAALTIAVSVTLEILLMYFLLTRLKIKRVAFNPALTHARDYLFLVAVVVPVAVLGAVSGMMTLWKTALVDSSLLSAGLINWWMGTTLGILVITPLTLIWRQRPLLRLTTERQFEALLCFGLAFFWGQVVFLDWHKATLGIVAYSYWAFFFVVWGATRFGRHGGLLIVVMTILQAITGAMQGLGFFALDHAQSGLANLWLYAMVLNLVGVMLALLMHERKLAEQLAQENEERHRTLVEWSPEAIAVHRDGRIIYVNPAAIKLAGAIDASDLIGLSIIDMVHPAFYQTALARIKSTYPRGEKTPMTEVRIFRLDGSLIDVEVQSTSITLDGKAAVHALIRDITKSKQADQYEQFRSRILELLAGGESLLKQMDALVRGVEQLHPAMLCSILLIDNDGRHLLKGVAPSLPDFYNQALDGIEIGIGVGSCGTAAVTRQRVIVEDITTHPYWAPYKELAASAYLGSCWSQPILDSAGKVLGTFAIYHHQAHTPTENDITIIEQSAHLASIAIERSVVAEKLKESESHYRLLTENVSDVAWKQDANSRYTYISPADEILRGYHSEEVVGHHVFEMLTPEGIDYLKEIIEQRRQSEEQGQITGPIPLELQQRCKDGRWIWTEILSTPERNADGVIIGYHGMTRDITQRKLAEAELRIAAIAFQSQEGMFVTDTSWVILRVNQAFTHITGHSSEEAVGKTPLLLTSLRHDSTYFASMTRKLKKEGTWQGEIWNKRKNGEIYPAWLILTEVKAANGEVTHFVATLTDITSRKKAEDQIQNLAFYDPLTSLPNRRLLMDRLAQAITKVARHAGKGALLFIDLDNFKILNDTLGHDKGDLLLVQVAKRLSACTREGDTVARLGGDEFVVMLEGLSNPSLDAATEAEVVGDKILVALNQIYQLGDYSHHSTPSIGITLFGEQPESIDEPLKRADLAMYQAKAAGRNTLRFFDPKMQAEVTNRVALEAGLRDALEKNQFLLYYQAQVRGTGQLTGVEALVRWQHPQRGMVSPAEFIPLAEETGLILLLGHWVLETACRQLASWACDPQMRHLSLSVNVSPRQFHQRDFVDQVFAVLERTGARAERLKLELTESVLIANIEDVILKMGILKQHGVSFSIDDFGTGYSSLSYLKRLPLDQLKIDQGFVRDILIDSNDAAIAKMVIVLADSLGLSVIAEGVETVAQRDFLASHGCHAYQGYLFSRPLPPDQFELFARKETVPG